MKKILVLAVGASQLLLLPQINAANGAGNQEIAVSEDYEVKNGVQGLDRDAFISVARKVAKGSIPGNGDTKVRRLQGISEKTFGYLEHNNFKCEVPQELKNRKELGKRVLQQSVEAIEIPNGPVIVASNDAGTLVAKGRSGLDLYLTCSTDGGQTWQMADIFALEIKHMNGKFFAFGAKKIKEKWDFGEDMVDIYVSDNGTTWTPFFELAKSNRIFFGKTSYSGLSGARVVSPIHGAHERMVEDISLQTPYSNVMAYGNDKYIMVTGNGTVLTKGKDNGSEWEKSPTSITDIVNLDEVKEIIEERPFFFAPDLNLPKYYNPDDKRLQEAEIAFSQGNFVLKFSYKDRTFFCTTTDGISWKPLKSDNFSNTFKEKRGLVGGPLGFAYIGKENRLYYSPSGNNWDKAKLPEGPKNSFCKVMYVDSSFYGDMFIALPYGGGQDAVVGTQARKGGIEWSWIKLNISFLGELVESQDIKHICCVGKKIIIERDRSFFRPSLRAQLQANR